MSESNHILVVDDNEVNQKVATMLLRRLGCEVDIANNGREAVEAVARLTYAVVFMDCQMPVMDGYRATMMIREDEGERRHTPIIALTAHALQGDSEKCFAAGMDDYLAKPLRVEMVKDKLATWLPSVQGIQRAAAASSPQEPTEQAPDPDNEERALDEHAFAELREMAGDMLTEVLEVFLTDTQAQLQRLRESVACGDLGAVHKIAHSLKGTSANVGALTLSRCCTDLYAIPPGELEHVIGEHTQRIELAYREVAAALRSHLPALMP